MTDIWVCTNCKSINRVRDTRCYSCGQRQEEVATSYAHVPQEWTAVAAASRSLRPYQSSLPYAVAAGVLIVASAILGLWLTVETRRSMDVVREAFVQAVLTNDTAALNPLLAEQQRLSSPSSLQLLVYILALCAFGLWLGRVRLNLPALGLGAPAWGPWKAFVYPLIPLANLFLVPGKLNGVMSRLGVSIGGLGGVALAWFAFVGSWVIAFVGSFALSATFANSVARATTEEDVANAFVRFVDQVLVVALFASIVVMIGALAVAGMIAAVEMRAGDRDEAARADVEGNLPVIPPPGEAGAIDPATLAADPSAAAPSVAAPSAAAPGQPTVTHSHPFATPDVATPDVAPSTEAGPLAPPPPPPPGR